MPETPPHPPQSPHPPLLPTGCAGLDRVLRGGLPADRLYLVEGRAGTGKTTLGLQFTLAGVRNGQRCLYVSLAETEAEIRGIARSHGWPLDGLSLYHQQRVGVGGDASQTVLHPAEVELPATVDALLAEIEAARPERLVIDSLSELRILARQPQWFRRELTRLRDRLSRLPCTTLIIDTEAVSNDAESLLGGVLRLERTTPTYGPERRHVHVLKIRGHEFETGFHDVRIRTGEFAVHPRLIAAHHRSALEPHLRSTGMPEFDRMLGGGLDEGAAVLFLGPTGAGKSTLAFQCATAAAARGEKVLAYVFDERIQTALQRTAGLGIDLAGHVEAGRVELRQIDPAEMTPGEFAGEVQDAVQNDGVRTVLIDSLNGYLYAMPEERLLNLHLHELLAYLAQIGVTTLMIGTRHGVGSTPTLPAHLDVSYLADTVVLLDVVVERGRQRKLLSVYKRRSGAHDTVVRELQFGPVELSIGAEATGSDTDPGPGAPSGSAS